MTNFMAQPTKISELENYARQITADYRTRFQNSGTRIGRGVFSKTAGTVLGGFGMMGQVASTVINSATDLSFGFIKIAGASKDFKQKMIQKIKDQAQNLPSSKSMMQSYLEINSNNAQAIMEELNKAGFIISNEDIDYKNCPKIITLNLNEFNATKDTILTNCNRIAQYMGATDNHQTQRTALQENLAQTFTSQLQGTFSTEIVQPIMNIPAGYAAGYVSEKFAESLAKLAKSGNQEPTEDADPVKIKNKKKNKFTPTKRGDSSNQDEAVETNDENSPRKPFRKFTKAHAHTDNGIDLDAQQSYSITSKLKQELTEINKEISDYELTKRYLDSPVRKSAVVLAVWDIKKTDPEVTTAEAFAAAFPAIIKAEQQAPMQRWNVVVGVDDATIIVGALILVALTPYALKLGQELKDLYKGYALNKKQSSGDTVNQYFTPHQDKTEQEYIPIHEDPNKGIIADPIPPKGKPDIETIPIHEDPNKGIISDPIPEKNKPDIEILPIPEDIGVTIHHSEVSDKVTDATFSDTLERGNIIYKDSDKHHTNVQGNISPPPKNPNVIKNSIKVKGSSEVRVAVDKHNDEIVVFRLTRKHADGKHEYHGYASDWKDLSQEAQNVLQKNKLVTKKGRIEK